ALRPMGISSVVEPSYGEFGARLRIPAPPGSPESSVRNLSVDLAAKNRSFNADNGAARELLLASVCAHSSARRQSLMGPGSHFLRACPPLSFTWAYVILNLDPDALAHAHPGDFRS